MVLTTNSFYLKLPSKNYQFKNIIIYISTPFPYWWMKMYIYFATLYNYKLYIFTVEKTYMQKNSEKIENYPYSNYIIIVSIYVYMYVYMCIVCGYIYLEVCIRIIYLYCIYIYFKAKLKVKINKVKFNSNISLSNILSTISCVTKLNGQFWERK